MSRRTNYERQLESELCEIAKKYNILYTPHEKDTSLLAEKLHYIRNHPIDIQTSRREALILEVLHHVTKIDPDRYFM